MNDSLPTEAPRLADDLMEGRRAAVETREGRFVTGRVTRVWQTMDGTPIALVVDDTTIPWGAILAIRPIQDEPIMNIVIHPQDPPGFGVIANPSQQNTVVLTDTGG